MAHENYPSDKNPTGTRLPHSGNMDPKEGGERPVHEYDNTSLDEAHQQGLIGEAPNTVAQGFGEGLTDEERAFIEERRREQSAKPEAKKSHKKGIIATVGGVATAAVATGVVLFSQNGGSEANHTPNHDPSQPVATGVQSPGPSHEQQSSSGEYSPDKPDLKLTSIIDSKYYKSLNPEQQQTIKKFHNMDVPTFEKQPVDKQRMFSRAERNAYRGYTIKMINDLLPNGLQAGTSTTPVPLNSTPEQIMRANMLDGVIPYMMLTHDMDPTKVYDQNRADAIKTVIGYHANPETPGAKSDISNLNTIDALNGNMYYAHAKTATKIDSSTKPDGTKEEVIAVHYTEVDDGLANIYDQTYTMDYEFYKDIQGRTVGEWLTQDVQTS